MKFLDSLQIAGTHTRDDGYLVVDARVARTGIQTYAGHEVGRPDLETVNIYRSADEVFSKDALASFAHRPVTDDHPDEAVTADNWKDYAVGQSDGNIARDGDFIRIPLMLADGAVIRKVQDGKRELSAGYTCDLDWTEGVTADGQKYHASQKNIRANHVAVVSKGRAGAACRIGDGWGKSPNKVDDKETTMGTRTIMVDGLSVETTDQGAQAIEKLTKDRNDLQKQLSDAQKDHATALATKDADIAKVQAQLDDAKTKIPDAAAITKLIADRVALESNVAKIAKDLKPAGLSDADLKKAAVKAVLGDKISEAQLSNVHYVDARFDILVEDAGNNEHQPDPFRDHQMQRDRTSPAALSDAEKAREAAWQGLVHYDQTGKEKAN